MIAENGRKLMLAACMVLAAAIDAADVSFSMKVAKSTEQPQKVITSDQMKSFREEEDRLVWRGHPLLGETFTVTATRKQIAAGIEWNVAYEGNETDWFVEEVAFPQWAVPRTDRTIAKPSINVGIAATKARKVVIRRELTWL